MSEENQSPFNWYLGTYVVSFNLVDVDETHDLHDQFDAWEVSVMVRAESCRHAYDRVIEVAQRDTRQYIGELAGTSIDWVFRGVTELDPLYTDVDAATDVVYVEHNHTRLSEQQEFFCQADDFK